jgi:hypothetical protein
VPILSYDPNVPAGDAGSGQPRGHGVRPRRAVARCRPAVGVDAAGRRRPAVACRPGRPGIPGVRVRQAPGARDRHRGARGAAAARAAPGRRGSHAGPVRRGDPAGIAAAGGRDRRRAGGSGPAHAAGAPGPGPRRGRPLGARADAGRLLRRRDRGRVRRRAHPGPPDLGGIRGGRPAGAARTRAVRGQRGRRCAAGARPRAGRDGPVGLPVRVPDRRPGRAARPEVRQPGAGGQSRPVAGRRADPAGGVGPDVGAGPARRGTGAVRRGREAGRRRGGPSLPRAPGRCVRVLSAAGRPDGARDGSPALS